MAKRKPTPRKAKKAAKKVARKVGKKAAKRRSPARRPARAQARPRKPAAPERRFGVITHTELASADPVATRAWCERVLAWKFGEPVPTPTGPYHMWRFENATGGGIRANNPPEAPGSIPYCEVDSIHETFARALEAGATEMLGPQELPGGMGWIAIVSAPGGVAFGLWAMR